ncbi:hypothetical protein [Xenorhabdus bovienii]|uniref:Uncharacterized protein n=1 Tax=Xenorhabdus bovienii str. kraussei Becker Underwood TaxID=1398204 RepID=A0A077PWI9_XENBV|nr:hypothetical protein [Xenorhabdus bovienii]CDH25082.1 conserved hypothetical protein [Xenorhabdus bovienii str. kraussei Becker Underwood]
MFVEEGLKPDPDNAGFVLGWGVVRYSPWHLAGVYATKEKAEIQAVNFGSVYEVHYGSHRTGSDDFVWGIDP